MQNKEDEGTEIIAERLAAAIELRETSAAQVARDSGVSKSTISQILAGDRPNTPAVIIAKLAKALVVSVDYLVGLSDEPEPRSLELGEILLELTRVARQLTSRRQRDLLLTARAYLEASGQLKGDPDLLMSDLLDMIQESGGKASRDRLIELLDTLGEDDELPGSGLGILPDDSEEPPEGDS